MKTEIPGGHLDHLKLGSEQIKMLSCLRKTVVNVGLTRGARQRLGGRWDEAGVALQSRGSSGIPIEGM